MYNVIVSKREFANVSSGMRVKFEIFEEEPDFMTGITHQACKVLRESWLKDAFSDDRIVENLLKLNAPLYITQRMADYLVQTSFNFSR